MKFEIPLVIEVEAPNRSEAEDTASDLADSISEIFQAQCTALLTAEHNTLERLGIDPAGVAA